MQRTITPQEQYDIALELARQDPATRTYIVIHNVRWWEINILKGLTDGDMTRGNWQVTLENGAMIQLLAPVQKDHWHYWGGMQITTLFMTEGTYECQAPLETRMRSASFKGKFKTYNHGGYVSWKETERYGS